MLIEICFLMKITKQNNPPKTYKALKMTSCSSHEPQQKLSHVNQKDILHAN